MSAVLGPIHQWMWQKIKLVKAREEALLEALYEKFGDEAAAVAKEAYGQGRTVRDVMRDKALLSDTELTEALDPRAQTEGGLHAGAGSNTLNVSDFGDADEGEIAVAPGELGKSVAGSRTRRRETRLDALFSWTTPLEAAVCNAF